MIHLINKLIVLLFTILSLLAANLFAQHNEDPYRTDLFRTSASPDVQVSTSGGSVSLFGHNENSVRIQMYVRRGNRYLSPADTDLSEFDIVIEQNGDKIIAEAQRKNSGRFWLGTGTRNISISFDVYLPEASVANGSTSGGSVSAEDIKNRLTLRTSGGSVNVNNVHGYAELRTSGGSIELENMSGSISARTSGGSVRVSNLSGEAELRTSGGSIRLENIAAKISARTSGGSINAGFTSFNEDIDLRTSGGSISINLPTTDNFNLDLSGGKVITELRNFTGSTDRRRIVGQIGNGGPTISARTSAGTVELRY